MSDTKEVSNLEVRSECGASNASRTSSSRCSSRSNSSQVAAEARAKAEAARKRAEYAKLKIDMEVERTRIDATLNALKEEGEAEAALAAAKVLEAAAENESSKADTAIGPPLSPAVSKQRTDDYTDAHFSHQEDDKVDKGKTVYAPKSQYDTLYSQCMMQPVASSTTQQQPQATRQPTVPRANINTFSSHSPQGYNTASSPHKVSDRLAPRTTDVSDLAAFLACRDLLTSGLKVFDNHPENYLLWRSTLCKAIDGLYLKPSEELDLLTKWLGGELLQHAQRIKAVHINDPIVGLDRLWQRLNKAYGSPEQCF